MAGAANSTSTATSGAFAAAVPQKSTLTRKRQTRLSTAANDNVPDPEVPLSNAETCSMATADGKDSQTLQGESPLKIASKKKMSGAPLIKPKVPRPVHTINAASRASGHLLGPAFSKSIFVCIIAIVLGFSFWNWNASKAPYPEISSAIQVQELEDFSRKTTKWMQVQLELVDMKIGKEVHELKREMEEKMEEQALNLETNIRNLKLHVDDMDTSLQKLTSEGLLSKKEGKDLIDSILQQRAVEESGKAVSLDDVRIAARQIVEAELTKHSADGIARVDYALGSGGGKVVDHSEGYFHGSRTSWLSLLGSGLSSAGSVKHPTAQKILEPSFGEPGQCLPLKGSEVYVEIALRTQIYPQAITLEHVSKRVAYDVSSAPKEFRVFGWMEKSIQANTIMQPVKRILLGEFTYDVEKQENVQTFEIPEEVGSKMMINTVRVDVMSNYGSSSHTCIYRVRVHGYEREARKTLV